MAQVPTVTSMEVAPMDLSASLHRKTDLNGKVCGLVKVQLALNNVKFEGNVIGESEYKTGEYWVYMTDGSYELHIKHQDYLPLEINFQDYGVNGVASLSTYKLRELYTCWQ